MNTSPPADAVGVRLSPGRGGVRLPGLTTRVRDLGHVLVEPYGVAGGVLVAGSEVVLPAAIGAQATTQRRSTRRGSGAIHARARSRQAWRPRRRRTRCWDTCAAGTHALLALRCWDRQVLAAEWSLATTTAGRNPLAPHLAAPGQPSSGIPALPQSVLLTEEACLWHQISSRSEAWAPISVQIRRPFLRTPGRPRASPSRASCRETTRSRPPNAPNAWDEAQEANPALMTLGGRRTPSN